MIINSKCNNCNEASKVIIGFLDGANGASGNLFDCQNINCPVKIIKDETERIIREEKNEVARENLTNNINAKNLMVARQSKGLLIYQVAQGIGISSAELSSYEHERQAIPKELYANIMRFIATK